MDIVSMDKEDGVEDLDDAKKDLLDRVRHLSDYQINNDNTRLSFGIQENLTKMQDLSVGGVKKFDKSSVGVQDGTDRLKKSPLKQMNTTLDTHENREPPPISEGKSLGSLASRHLSDTMNSGGKGFTLGSFGPSSQGCLSLPSGSGTLGVILPSNKMTGKEGTGISLNSLANSHLGGKSGLGGLQTSGLTFNSLTSKPSSGNGGLSDMANTSQPLRPSLGALASNHLSGSQESKPSLGAFASNHYSGSQAPRLSLTALASTHLSGSSVPSESKAQGLSLNSLAATHLASGSAGLTSSSLGSFSTASMESSSSNTQKFTIPAIFGPKTCPPVHKERSASPEVEIDLMSALNLGAGGQEVLEEMKTAEVAVAKVELVVPDISRISSELRKRKRSAFSKVITRKWARSDIPTKVAIRLPTNNIPVFQFDQPSPDDIVLKAQSQSKAFNRPSPVRQVRQPLKT